MHSFLGTFLKFQKAAINFVLSVCCLSICMQLLRSQWLDFHEIWHLSIFKKYVKKNSDFIKIWQE